jgi:hypothetical protein
MTSSSRTATVTTQTSADEATTVTSTANVEKWTEVLESIVTSVDVRQDARAAQLEAAAGGQPIFETTLTGKLVRQRPPDNTLGGPLSSTDISKLSVLCAEIASHSSSGFNQVDPELLLQASTMLEAHVSSASSVDLIREVHRLLSKGDEGAEKRNGKSKSVLVEEVGTSSILDTKRWWQVSIQILIFHCPSGRCTMPSP